MPMFKNFYKCPECEHEWEDVYDAQPDDDCPNCGKRHISPYKSEDEEDEEEENVRAGEYFRKGEMVFEITHKGFYGGDDKTDHYVKWVEAENRDQVNTLIDKLGFDLQENPLAIEVGNSPGIDYSIIKDGYNLALARKKLGI